MILEDILVAVIAVLAEVLQQGVTNHQGAHLGQVQRVNGT